MPEKRWLYLAALLALGAAVWFAPLPAAASQPAARSVHIDAAQYAYSPGEIRVNRGDRVTIELASTDVVHGLYLDGYGLSVTADPGQPGYLTFTADRAGRFRFRCNVTCGAMHPFMTGRLVVSGNDPLLRALLLVSLAGMAALFFPRRMAAT